MVARPFRFGLQAARVNDPEGWLALARFAEDVGYSCLMIPDHLGRLATFPALMAAASATRHTRLATYVLNQDFRPPAVLAQEAATVQLLTGGRLELGVGAGWARREYIQTGIRYDPPGVRVERFEEYLTVVKGLLNACSPFSFTGKHFTIDEYQPFGFEMTPPPIVVGGGSPRMMRIAGRLADIVSIAIAASPDGRMDLANMTLEAVEGKLRNIQQAAADRDGQVELNMTIHFVRVTPDREAAATELVSEWAAVNGRFANVDQVSLEDVLASPHMAIGTVEQIVEQFEIARERWGVNYIEVTSTDAKAVAPVMERLNGR
jgi:probable F420-dependent oxidoreductase